MLTEKHYKQRWLQFKYKNKNPNLEKSEIWSFQKSILSPPEQKLCDIFSLRLPETDPRHWVIQESDRVYKQLRNK